MDRKRTSHPDGTVTLTGSGSAGAVTLEAWEHKGQSYGLITLHMRRAGYGFPLAPCTALGGSCFHDVSYTAGAAAAPLALYGREEEAWEVVETWYRERIEGITG